METDNILFCFRIMDVNIDELSLALSSGTNFETQCDIFLLLLQLLVLMSLQVGGT